MGFISCMKLRAKHGVDVRIYRDEFDASRLAVGDTVAFNIVFGGRLNCPKSHPWATDVERSDLPEDAAEECAGDATPVKPGRKRTTSDKSEDAGDLQPVTKAASGDPQSVTKAAGTSPTDVVKPKPMLETLKSLRGEVPKE